MGTPKHIPIFESPCKSFKDGPRFLWQYAVDYAPRIKSFSESIRLWRICLQHDDVPKGMEYIISSYKRGRTSSVKKMLKPLSGKSCWHLGRRIPRQYVHADLDTSQGQLAVEETMSKDAISFETLTPGEGEEEEAGTLEYAPPAMPAAHGKEYFNVLKFYSLSEQVVSGILAELDYSGAAAAAAAVVGVGGKGGGGGMLYFVCPPASFSNFACWGNDDFLSAPKEDRTWSRSTGLAVMNSW